MSALASGLGVLRFQLQIGRIQMMAVIALVAAVCCSPVLVHGEGRGGLPILANLVFAGFIIAAPLLVHGAEPCLRGLPVSPARQRLCGYLAMLLISWLGMLAAMLQLPFASAALHDQGWPTFGEWLEEACTAPFWLMLMVPIAAVLRHRLRVVAVIAVVVAVLVMPDQSRAYGAVRTALMLPASLCGWDTLGRSILLGVYGVMIAGVLAVLPGVSMEIGPASVSADRLLMPRLGGWGGVLRAGWEMVVAQTIARLLAPLGARARMVVLVLADSTSVWIVLALLVLILVIGRHLYRPTIAPGTLLHVLPYLMAAVLVGAWQVTTMTQRLCQQALLSRHAALLVSLVSGPLMILCASAALYCWRPLVSTYPGVGTTPVQYFAAVFPQSSSVRLPTGKVLTIDDYCLRLGREHVAIDPGFLRAQCLANWRIAAHSADLQVPEPLLHPHAALAHRLSGTWITAESYPWRPARGSHKPAYDLTAAQLKAVMEPEQYMRQEIARVARILALLASGAAGTCFLLILALIISGRDRLVFGTGMSRLAVIKPLGFLTWGQVTGGVLMLGSLALMAWPSSPVPISADQPLPPVPMSQWDRLLIGATGHVWLAAAIIALATVLALAWLRHAIRSLPLR